MLSLIKQLIQPTPNPSNILQNATKVALPAISSNLPDTDQDVPEIEEEVSTRRVAKLIMVTAQNNNKFYEMKENEDGTFTATYGRVGNKGTSVNYPMSQWDRIFRGKVNKGYTDQTDLFAEKKEELERLEIEDKAVEKIINLLMKYANQSISYNYNVSADQVTRKQVEEAQDLLDNLVNRVKIGMRGKYFNDKLLALYQVIPRRMTKVKDHLIKTPKTAEDIKLIDDLLAKEQATLDVMRSQVELNEQKADKPKKAVVKQNLLDAMGIQMEPLKDKKLLKTIKKMMGTDANKFKCAYKVINVRTQKAYDRFLEGCSDKKAELFWHGSRNENWLSILQSGLVLRPANAVINGKMFGYGLYFADKFKKSLNYTSYHGSYWTGGSQNKGFLALYDVHVGKQLKIKKHQPWCGQLNADNLKKKGAQYNSIFAKGGADLINNEYIVYNQDQCTVRYLVEIE